MGIKSSPPKGRPCFLFQSYSGVSQRGTIPAISLTLQLADLQIPRMQFTARVVSSTVIDAFFVNFGTSCRIRLTVIRFSHFRRPAGRRSMVARTTLNGNSNISAVILCPGACGLFLFFTCILLLSFVLERVYWKTVISSAETAFRLDMLAQFATVIGDDNDGAGRRICGVA
jgi:hypothetical protein